MRLRDSRTAIVERIGSGRAGFFRMHGGLGASTQTTSGTLGGQEVHMRNTALLALALGLGGCAALEDIADGVEPPEAALNRVDLLHAPTGEELVAWQCDALFGSAVCQGAGLPAAPGPKKLTYSFDLVFDLSNPNKSIPIPLVEILIGMHVFDVNNLGSACISFCDPDVEDCTPALNAEGACLVEEADEVKSPEDLIPTVDDLVDLAEDAAAGELGENTDWRVIPGGEDTEGHIQFDLSANVMLDLADLLLEDAVDDALNNRPISVEVPYTTEGTVFFDVPKLGRHAAGFGPWDDSWVLE